MNPFVIFRHLSGWIQNLRWDFCHPPVGAICEFRGLGY